MPEILLSEFERWQERYSGSEYAFGREPNCFLNPRGGARDAGGNIALRNICFDQPDSAKARARRERKQYCK